MGEVVLWDMCKVFYRIFLEVGVKVDITGVFIDPREKESAKGVVDFYCERGLCMSKHNLSTSVCTSTLGWLELETELKLRT